MTRKDFELIAGIINKYMVSEELNIKERLILQEISRDFSIILQTTNPNFDRGRFMKACGL